MRLKVKSCVGSISPLLALIKFLKSLNFKRNDSTFSKEIIRNLSLRLLPLLLKLLWCVLYLCQPHCRELLLLHFTRCSSQRWTDCGLSDLEGPLSQGNNVPTSLTTCDKNGPSKSWKILCLRSFLQPENACKMT